MVFKSNKQRRAVMAKLNLKPGSFLKAKQRFQSSENIIFKNDIVQVQKDSLPFVGLVENKITDTSMLLKNKDIINGFVKAKQTDITIRKKQFKKKHLVLYNKIKKEQKEIHGIRMGGRI